MAIQRRLSSGKGILKPADWKLTNYSKAAKEYYGSAEAHPDLNNLKEPLN
jgi:hypothetical protein